MAISFGDEMRPTGTAEAVCLALENLQPNFSESKMDDLRVVNSQNDFLGRIFVAEDIITADAERVAFGNVKFKKDIGPWKKEQVVQVLVFDNVFGYLQTEKEDGIVLQQCKLKLEADL